MSGRIVTGRCWPCGGVYKWRAPDGRLGRLAYCQRCGSKLAQTTHLLKKGGELLDGEPVFLMEDPTAPASIEWAYAKTRKEQMARMSFLHARVARHDSMLVCRCDIAREWRVAEATPSS